MNDFLLLINTDECQLEPVLGKPALAVEVD
jgi:hypothetical protein